MRVLVLGSGGREHALVWKLSQEAEVFAAPGNPGIASICECFPVAATDNAVVLELAKRLEVKLVVVGPEDPLIVGVADVLRAANILVYGPGASGARLEGSKAFSKEMMQAANIPTAEFKNCTSPHEAKAYAQTLCARGRGVVVKASGAALGKGVVVCDSYEEAEEAIEMMMVERAFGASGDTVVVERRLTGREFSLLTVCSGTEFRSLPVAQDYKRAIDGDRGPNTGGMGSYSPVAWVSDNLVVETEACVVKPLLQELAARGIDYRGTLFSGLMVEDARPYCLEYNVRFGDPETQSVMMRLGSGFMDLLLAAAKGMALPTVNVLENSAVSVVVASGGYPGAYEKGKSIKLPAGVPENVQIFHAGTSYKDGQLVTAGGRVLSVSSSADTVARATQQAYAVARQVQFEGAYCRSDIAAAT